MFEGHFDHTICTNAFILYEKKKKKRSSEKSFSTKRNNGGKNQQKKKKTYYFAKSDVNSEHFNDQCLKKHNNVAN